MIATMESYELGCKSVLVADRFCPAGAPPPLPQAPPLQPDYLDSQMRVFTLSPLLHFLSFLRAKLIRLHHDLITTRST